MTSCENEWRHDATLPYLFIFFYLFIIIINTTLQDLFISDILIHHFFKNKKHTFPSIQPIKLQQQ